MRDDVFCFFSRSISDAQCAFSFRLPHVLHCCLCLRLYVAIVYKFAFILLYADYVIYANCAIYARLFYTVILPAFVIFYVPSRWKTKAATHNWLNRRFIVMRGGYEIKSRIKVILLLWIEFLSEDIANNGKYCCRSFASKFCHYTCFCLFEDEEEQDNYSNYDSVVRKMLPEYIKHFKLKKRSQKESRKLRRTPKAHWRNNRQGRRRNRSKDKSKWVWSSNLVLL